MGWSIALFRPRRGGASGDNSGRGLLTGGPERLNAGRVADRFPLHARRAPPHPPGGRRTRQEIVHSMSRWRIGVDSGGTFTDVCLFDEQSGRVEVWKVPSTPDDPS